ncbi:glycosyltransferase [Moritella sp.]|uniref:glycosyltransferase n=1 Tax=Moritella sp. TaxID=78556 RepID=UPI001D6510F7|nr:glycosyltransferase [Moritella sp.]MCJ8347950.1 glycosyltransferase [Moritella sp.]NQZ40377.1 glycosyltransferase [Moritella sp.]
MSRDVFVCNSFSDGGGEKVFSLLYSDLKKKAIFVSLFDSFTFIKKTNRIIVLERGVKKNKIINVFFMFFFYFNLIKKSNPQRVISHLHLSNVFNVIGSFYFNYDSHVVIHGFLSYYTKSPNVFKRLYGELLIFLYKKSTSVIVVSDGLVKEMSSYGINSTLIYNPVTTTKKNSLIGDDLNFDFKKDSFNFIVIARLVSLKRIDDILTAISYVEKVNLYVVGSGNESDFLKKRTQELCINDRVFFLGFVRDISSHLLKFDCLVSASEIETFGLTILESLLSGIPVISSNCDSGPRDLFKSKLINGSGIVRVPGKGMLYDVGDVEQLKVCIHEMINNKSNYKPLECDNVLMQKKFSTSKFISAYSSYLN